MAQFDAYANPVAAARRAYPYVVILQSAVAGHGRDTIVAPLAPSAAFMPVTGRLTPVVPLDASDYVVIIPALTSVRTGDLDTLAGSLLRYRTELMAAIDYLFFGV